MFGYHKPRHKYPIASKIEFLAYLTTFGISALFLAAHNSVYQEIMFLTNWTLHGLAVAFSSFFLAFFATLVQIEKKKEEDNAERS